MNRGEGIKAGGRGVAWSWAYIICIVQGIVESEIWGGVLVGHRGETRTRGEMGMGSQKERDLTARAIEQAEARLDGIVDGVGADSLVNFPQTKAHLRHVVAATELEGWHHLGHPGAL